MANAPRKRLKARDDAETYVKELMDDFIIEKQSDGRSSQTLESYNNSFKKFLDYFGEDMKVKDVNKGTMIQYKNHLQKEDQLALASINHYVRDMRTFLNWGHKAHYFPKLEVTLLKGQTRIKQVYSTEELKKLLVKPTKRSSFAEWRTWAIINWILGTGNRIDTIINVRLGDIHFGQGLITIRAQKNKRANNIPLDRNLASVLREYIKIYRSEAADNEYLFCNIYGEKLTTKAFQHALVDYNRKHGVEKTSAHALRHTFAKLFIENSGGDVFRLQRILGHSTLEMTRQYVNLFDTDLKRGYDDISPLSQLTKRRGSRSHKIKASED